MRSIAICHLPIAVLRPSTRLVQSDTRCRWKSQSVISIILPTLAQLLLFSAIDDHAACHPYRPYRRQTIARSLHLPDDSHRLVIITITLITAYMFDIVNSTPQPAADTVSRLQLAAALYGRPGAAERDHREEVEGQGGG